MNHKKRPKHLALHKIQLPLPAFVSILHRISGAVLFLALPLLLLLLDQSLRSIETYTNLAENLSHPLLRLGLLGLISAFLLHFLAGVRHLAIDCTLCRALRQRAQAANGYWASVWR